MRSAGFVVIALAAVAAAGPLVERDPKVVTKYETVNVYTTVTEFVHPQPTGAKNGGWNWFGHRPKVVHTTTTVMHEAPAEKTTTPAPAPEPKSNPAPSNSAASGPNQYAQRVVAHHNAHRANHSAPAMVWDDSLAATALKIANTCIYRHVMDTDGGGYGQNIAAGAPVDNITSVVSDLFYNGEAGLFNGLYGQATPSNINNHDEFDKYGHFTQIVWVNTTHVGCASVDCTGRGNGPKGLGNVGLFVAPIFTVCKFYR